MEHLNAEQRTGLEEALGRALAKLERSMRTTDEALKPVTYGVCVECEGAIPFERLEVFPETPTCTVCSPT